MLPSLQFTGPNNTQIPFNSSSPSSFSNATPCGAIAAVALEIVLFIAYDSLSPSSSSFSPSVASALAQFDSFANHVLEREGYPSVVLWHSEMFVQASLLRVRSSLVNNNNNKKENETQDAVEVVTRLLRHPAYDVREVVLKLISQLWKSNSYPVLHDQR